MVQWQGGVGWGEGVRSRMRGPGQVTGGKGWRWVSRTAGQGLTVESLGSSGELKGGVLVV